ncbi:sugar phosphate isomerase/epimerase [Salicibibacter cibarius]|uniref:Sugar phosphate isomerase/epimerase n=1 Tax=Salicibibacter cibarius TaxID=2743000 RepID=A0A7T7CAZ6_9BACI|nr:sugar phosphate isomerase/epimerase family protein [Salicibibacter cibarius]QQK75363.1 sugar phosphate isomerase/epimerase [Salicibibacter cibarius]
MLSFAYPYQTEETIKPLFSAKGSAKEIIPSLASFGYDGIELLVRDAREAKLPSLLKLITDEGLKVASFATSPMVADDRLSFSALDESIRDEAVKRTINLIEWAEEFDCPVIIGKLRGQISDEKSDLSWEYMRQSFARVLDVAEKKNVPILIEPQNENNMNNLNRTDETMTFIQSFKSANLGLMLDCLHMEAESHLFQDVADQLGFIHLTDSDRLMPGEGTFDMNEIVNAIQRLPRPPFVSFEIKQQDSSLAVAKKALETMKKMRDSDVR